MSEQCLNIQVVTPPDGTRPFMMEGGRFYLDLSPESNVSLSKKIEQLEVTGIQIESVLGFELPATPKNNWLLRAKVLPTVLDQTNDAVRVRVFIGGRVLRQTSMYVISFNNSETNPTYSVEIRTDSQDHWIVAAKDLQLNEIDFGGTKTFDEGNVNYSNSLTSYVDGDSGIRYPLCNYGNFVRDESFALNDLRPWYCAYWVLERGFCALGWNFSSEVLNTVWGRSLICYLLSPNIGEDASLISSRRFNAIKTNTSVEFPNPFPPEVNSSWVVFNQEVEDNGNNYDTSTGFYSGAGIMDVFVKVRYKIHFSSTTILNNNIKPIDLHTKLQYNHPTLGTLTIESQTTQFTNPEYTDNQDYFITHEFVKRDVQVDAGASLAVLVQWDGTFDLADDGELSVLPTSQFYNEVKSVYLQSGDVFDMSLVLNSSYNFLDFVKGIAHLFSGKFYTNFNTRTVYIEAPYTVLDQNAETVTGFFDEVSPAINLETSLVANSEKITTPNQEFVRYDVLKFKGDGDASIQELNLPENSWLFAHTTDNGDKYPEEYNVDENPFFEATLNKLMTGRFRFLVNLCCFFYVQSCCTICLT